MPASESPHFSSSVKPGEPQIGELDAAVLGEDHVLGLDVAVDQPLLGGVLERLGDRQRDPEGFFLLEDLVLVEVILDRGPFDVFHDEVIVAVDLAGVDGVDHVIVRELGGDHGLALEPLDEFFVLGQRVEQDLDGDDPVDAKSAWP